MIERWKRLLDLKVGRSYDEARCLGIRPCSSIRRCARLGHGQEGQRAGLQLLKAQAKTLDLISSVRALEKTLSSRGVPVQKKCMFSGYSMRYRGRVSLPMALKHRFWLHVPPVTFPMCVSIPLYALDE